MICVKYAIIVFRFLGIQWCLKSSGQHQITSRKVHFITVTFYGHFGLEILFKFSGSLVQASKCNSQLSTNRMKFLQWLLVKETRCAFV